MPPASDAGAGPSDDPRTVARSCGDRSSACTTAGAWASAGGCAGGTGAGPERATVAASGLAIVLLAAALVLTGPGPLHLVLAGTAAGSGVGVAVLGGLALRRGGGAGQRAFDRAVGLLPYATGVLVVGLVARGAAFLTG